MKRTVIACSLLFVVTMLLAPTSWARDCTGTSTGMIPLIDLGSGIYQGFDGGLYAGGSNLRPPAHDAAGIAIAHSIEPLDTLGNVHPNGRVVFISIGMSNCTQEFSAFVPKANADPARNPNVLAIDCALGGQAADVINDPNAAYWDSVATRLRGRGSSPLQAQVVWIKEANRRPTGPFPASTDSLAWNLGAIVRIIKDKLPNVKIAYLSSRIYAGYASSNLNPEPWAYESGFAVKWLIAAQIAGVDSLEYDPASEDPVEAPWLSWGPYLWADGLDPRSDGLIWECADFSSNDGTHPSISGRNKVADMLLAFVHADATAKPWYEIETNSVPEIPGTLAFGVAPNPTSRSTEVSFAIAHGQTWHLGILDLAGRRIRDLGTGVGGGGIEHVIWDGRGSAGESVAAGVYFARLQLGAQVHVRPIVRTR